MNASDATAGLTMDGEKRAADPRTLFLPGGKSIGQRVREIVVPADIPDREAPEFLMDAFLTGVDYATQAAKQRARDQSRLSSGKYAPRIVVGRPPPGGHPLNSARVARGP